MRCVGGNVSYLTHLDNVGQFIPRVGFEQPLKIIWPLSLPVCSSYRQVYARYLFDRPKQFLSQPERGGGGRVLGVGRRRRRLRTLGGEFLQLIRRQEMFSYPLPTVLDSSRRLVCIKVGREWSIILVRGLLESRLNRLCGSLGRKRPSRWSLYPFCFSLCGY